MINRSFIKFIVFLHIGLMALGQDQPKITVNKPIDNPIATICYNVTSQMKLELSIINRQGFIVATPLIKNLTPVKDSIKISFDDYPTGTYFLGCKVNNVSVPIMKMIRHCKKGQQVTYSQEESTFHNKLPACNNALCPIGTLSDFDVFLHTYPNYIDKAEVYQRALLAYIKLDRNDLFITNTIDSLVTYAPTFYSYYSISEYLTEYHILPELTSHYLLKAYNTITTIPQSQQKIYATKLKELSILQQ